VHVTDCLNVYCLHIEHCIMICVACKWPVLVLCFYFNKVKTVGERKFRNCLVQSRNAVRTTKTVLTCLQFCSHHRQDKTGQDKTVLSRAGRWCELGLSQQKNSLTAEDRSLRWLLLGAKAQVLSAY